MSQEAREILFCICDWDDCSSYSNQKKKHPDVVPGLALGILFQSAKKNMFQIGHKHIGGQIQTKSSYEKRGSGYKKCTW